MHDRRGDFAEKGHGLVGDAGDELAGLADDLAELDEHERDEADEDGPEHRDDKSGDLAAGQP